MPTWAKMLTLAFVILVMVVAYHTGTYGRRGRNWYGRVPHKHTKAGRRLWSEP